MNELEILKNELEQLESKKSKNTNDLIKIKQLKKKINKFDDSTTKSTGIFVHNNTVQDIDVGLISPNPYQPRKVFDEDSINRLSESISQEGLIQPVVVIKDKDGYILVAGERRLRATKKLGSKTIKAIVDNQYTLNDLRTKAIIENLAREDLCLADEAVSIYSLIESGLSYLAIASKVSKSKTHIARMKNIAKLDENLLDYIRINSMKQTNAIEAIAMSQNKNDYKLELLKALNEKELSFKELKKLLDKNIIVPSRNTIKVHSNIEGVKVSPINKDTKKVKLELDFNKIKDLDKLFDLFKDMQNQLKF
jgi:ParB family chromosome partitioning protein